MAPSLHLQGRNSYVGRKHVSTLLKLLFGACHSEAETPSFSMEVFISNSDHEAYAREDHM